MITSVKSVLCCAWHALFQGAKMKREIDCPGGTCYRTVSNTGKESNGGQKKEVNNFHSITTVFFIKELEQHLTLLTWFKLSIWGDTEIRDVTVVDTYGLSVVMEICKSLNNKINQQRIKQRLYTITV